MPLKFIYICDSTPIFCEKLNREEALDKIRKCLALTASPNENEAKTALMMARRLMVEYKIGDIDLKEDNVEKIVETRDTPISYTTIRDNWISYLNGLISPRYCCRSFERREYGKKTRYISFIGFSADLDVCVPAFELAVSTIRNTIISRKYSKQEAHNYAMGFIKGLKLAFEEQDQELASTLCRETALTVCIEVPKEVDDYVKNNFSTCTVKLRNYSLQQQIFDTGVRDGRNHLKKKIEEGIEEKMQLK